MAWFNEVCCDLLLDPLILSLAGYRQRQHLETEFRLLTLFTLF